MKTQRALTVHTLALLGCAVLLPLTANAGTYYYQRSSSGPSSDYGYSGPSGGDDTQGRGVWQTRYNKWVQAEQARQQAFAGAPCGIYGRAPASCYQYTTPYLPWVHGDR